MLYTQQTTTTWLSEGIILSQQASQSAIDDGPDHRKRGVTEKCKATFNDIIVTSVNIANWVEAAELFHVTVAFGFYVVTRLLLVHVSHC